VSRRRWAAVQWVAALAAVAVLASCAGSSVPLERLVSRQDRYVGQVVTTGGMVSSFQEPDGTTSYILEDEAQDRVLLLPADTAAGYLGQSVQVTGLFDFDPERGRTLTVQDWHAGG
jgi:hypothetical protein